MKVTKDEALGYAFRYCHRDLRRERTCGPAAAPSTVTGASLAADPALSELRIDYATYSPPSLVLKKQGWVEEAFKSTSI